MSSTGIIRRATDTSDGTGSYYSALLPVGTVSCDVWPASPKFGERIAGDQNTSIGDWYITVPYGTSLLASDVIEVDNKSYEITFVPNGSSWQTAIRVEANSYNEEKRT